MPKVSVIVPNYNHAPYLDQRIRSIVSQTYQDFELIYLDDASTDNSNEIFHEFSNDFRIKAIFNDVNSGSPFKQWNKGISVSEGEYIWIAESDDFASPNFLEKLVPVLDEHHNVGIAYCQSCLVDENNKIISQNFLECTSDLDPERWKKNFINNGKSECKNYLAASNTIPNASAVLFRKSLYIDNVSNKNENFRIAGDWFTWAKILLYSDIYYFSESMNYFRFCQGSVSRNINSVSFISRESFFIFTMIKESVGTSQKAQEIAFHRNSTWLLSSLILGDKLHWFNILKSYRFIFKIAPNWTSLLALHWKLLMIPISRLRYKLKLGTKLRNILSSSDTSFHVP
jgi:glycosyltransferase involved in cell wall biosynthesis